MLSSLFTFFFFFFLSFLLVDSKSINVTLFPAIYVFGDSTVDPGNNNFIATLFRGNHPPYGLNFQGSIPTGRLTDGKLIPDFLASMFHLKETIPPFLDPYLSDNDILTGVSFASAGSGYDEMTSTVSLGIPFSGQLEYFRAYIRRLESVVGEKEAIEIVKQSPLIISAGTNDFVLNFYDIPRRRTEFTIDKYQDFLLNKLHTFVEELYDLGGRKIVVAGLPPLGCLPIQMTAMSPLLRRCIHRQNVDAQSYNMKLQRILPRIETMLEESTIVYADIFTTPLDMVHNPHKYGFMETARGCCGSGVVEAGPLCTELSPICPNPNQYMFFDSIHPTELVYRIVTEQLTKLLIPILFPPDENRLRN